MNGRESVCDMFKFLQGTGRELREQDLVSLLDRHSLAREFVVR